MEEIPRDYHNENNAFAAQWTRNLMKAGHIPDGFVDERDIRDVQPMDLWGFTRCHFFSGIAGWAYALRLAGIPTISRFGPEVARASHFPPPDKVKAPPMIDTFGPHGSSSSKSRDLTECLASRLKRQLATAGSTLFSLTWKDKATPAGRPYCLLRASALHISDSDCGSWPTPVANDDNKSPEAHLAMKLRMGERDGTGSKRTAITSLQVMAKTASWRTPQATDGDHGGPNARDRSGAPHLSGQAAQAAWPTPNGEDAKAGARNIEGRKQVSLPRTAAWSTPRANKWGFPDAHGSQEAPWATPTANEKRRSEDFQEGRSLNAAEALGPKPIGLSVGTAKAGQLSPAHSRWLMGYPKCWDDCAPTVSPKSRKR